jgi:hypothetical protein
MCWPSALLAQEQSGAVLPFPPAPFKGTIDLRAKDSKSDFPQPVQAPQGAPNILLVLLDDVGFGMCSTFGGSAPTPNLQKLADNGLKYTRFHTTALCSPTRGALLAGRNHHSIATGVIIEMGTGYPGYTERSEGMTVNALTGSIITETSSNRTMHHGACLSRSACQRCLPHPPDHGLQPAAAIPGDVRPPSIAASCR